MKRAFVISLLFVSVSFGQAPKKLRAIFEVFGQDSGALLGYSVKGVGDLNKDGYADVAVSAPGRLFTCIYYGGKTMSPAPSYTLQGGGTVVSGDFDGDGWIDLAIEKFLRDTVFVYYGSVSMDTTSDRIYVGEHSSDDFGHLMATGDLNGDGIDELVIGSPSFPQGVTESSKGIIYVYVGSRTKLDSLPRQVILGDTGHVALGYDLAIGDIDGDRKGDIVALGYNSLSPVPSEQYYYFSVFLGDSTFRLHRSYYIDSRNVPGGFKSHITCFDADGDGVDDILVNRISVFKGGARLDTLPTYYIPSPNSDTTNFGTFPWVSGGGDFNRDGVKDILLSATQGYFGGVPGVYLYLDRRNHPGQYVANRIFSSYLSAALYGRPDNAGDVDGDGVDDIIIGSPFEPIVKDRGFFGIYSGDTSLVTGMNGLPLSRPKTFELNQNYPNPFNPSTTIRYGLPYRSHVTLTVFNTLGQQVTVLQNGDQEAGYYEVQFNASNLSSGVYFYRLRAGDFVETKRLLLLR